MTDNAVIAICLTVLTLASGYALYLGIAGIAALFTSC